MSHLTNYSVIQNLPLSVMYKKESKHFISTNANVLKPTRVKMGLGIYYYSNIVSTHPHTHPLILQHAVQMDGIWYLLALNSACMFNLGCKELIVVTDHKPLLGILNNRETNLIQLKQISTTHYQQK